uniref:Sod n=1 Tax=Spodoptera frugiperda granulovirus TaxID=307454 RepID=A0A346QVX1_9BBAC|nr:sod [Spodoptera frugiperda granulovirus]
MIAKAILSGDVRGEILFVQPTPASLMRITGVLHGLPFGCHGLHIHEFGDTSNGCTSAGEHLNPHHQPHGGQFSAQRHLGDLGNVCASTFEKIDHMLSLYGKHSILGRSIVVHTMEDDLGLSGDETGNSGGRLACGIIGVVVE